MNITILKSKIHRATVTDANLDYVGSITIDEEIMNKANILENEKVQIVNINNGERFETYVIKGEAGKGDICLNGAAARLVQPKDKVIIMSYCSIDQEKARSFKPTIVIVDENNKATNIEG
ncbi:aspartate 1-decarboxylase [Anaerosalibacter bizertensis]|uniref:Aspartate 1-decarboxylase n=1 Tax=Anaerosalibacter bizertensis TaxID=932217 RepID=A0A9Q4FM91_9FIRM|nr:aspartate 1-decarboxylase [Anaerosalibacter bizertensis]MBV1818216.1 aspartate 1-decarboxylase [Bacteroidales bacterium MSK.15.36]HHV27017.1 aspartate 1-decarboxylase [Tissierellia bacterium]MBU5294615.1 aspartate 1-decarboxylase [Anaerosalibacter bizertensis]MCB5559199.1 aspartate 1-decarboxylase [Anaerosalibacter bizertensis]MCG4565449.1 aspartate 1-decarboxylase [Anaerosalibacter bizertensis]